MPFSRATLVTLVTEDAAGSSRALAREEAGRGIVALGTQTPESCAHPGKAQLLQQLVSAARQILGTLGRAGGRGTAKSPSRSP